MNEQNPKFSADMNEVEDFDSEVIHETNPDADEFDDLDDKPRQNFQTGVPFDEESIESETSGNKKGGMKMIIALTVGSIFLALIVAVFFIARGKSNEETATIKDNSAKTSVNSNVSTSSSVPNFEQDYREKYDSNANVNLMSNNADSQTIAGVNNPAYPMNISGQPQPNYNGGIYQPGPQTSINANTDTQSSRNTNGGSLSESVTRVKPNNTEIIELPKNEEVSYRNTSGGRNEQSSLYFYDRNQNQKSVGNISRIDVENSSPIKPNFGTVLPVRVLGRLHTLGTNGLARMELMRTVQGSWGMIPRGTLLVGRVAGGEGSRVFVSLIGYIDSRSNRLVTLGGDLQDQDGALGMKGDVKRLGSRWSKVLGEVLSLAKEIGGAYLLGRRGGSGTVINNGQLERIPDSIEGKDTTRYTVVPAGANGYIVINDLPPAIESDERLTDSSVKSLTNEEILNMIQKNTPNEIERLIPSLSADGQKIARRALEDK